jgi:hypothetical protein
MSILFRRQLLSILFGAVIGFVPTVFLTVYQAHQQRNQAILERRLSALRDFSAAVGGGGELMATFNELDLTVQRLLRLPPAARTKADKDRIEALYKTIIAQQIKWAANVNSQGVIFWAVFKPRAETAERQQLGLVNAMPMSFSNYAIVDFPKLQTDEEVLTFMLTNVADAERKLADVIDKTQRAVVRHAAQVF